MLAIGETDGKIKVFKIGTHQLLKTLKVGLTFLFNALTYIFMVNQRPLVVVKCFLSAFLTRIIC